MSEETLADGERQLKVELAIVLLLAIRFSSCPSHQAEAWQFLGIKELSASYDTYSEAELLDEVTDIVNWLRA